MTPSHASSSPVHATENEQGSTTVLDDVWTVVLYDDPVNTMGYVSAALQEVLAVDSAKAEALMLEAHTNGKATVYSGERDEAERLCVALHGWTLHATVSR